jgi:glycerol-3-phosphate acyltransferase PlsY
MTYDADAPFQSIPFIIFSWLVAILLVWTHRKNISRLREGTESKIYLWGDPNEEKKETEETPNNETK